MNQRDGRDSMERRGGRCARRLRSMPLGAALLALLLVGCLFAAASAAAAGKTAAKPGKPIAKAPTGSITTATPTFSWSKVKGATKYEVRVYQGTKMLLKKTGVTKRSFKCTTALPQSVGLKWKVRASNARGSGAWSKSLTFQVAGAAAPVVGEAYQGGIVGYVYQVGDPGYVEGQSHGLISSPGDVNSMGIQWSNGGAFVVTGATGTALGTGSANTAAIIAAQGGTATSYAAGLAKAYTGGGYKDWYLPSKDELNKLYLNQAAIGGSWSALVYWTSSEASAVSAYSQNFANGHAAGEVKDHLQGVRAVRSF